MMHKRFLLARPNGKFSPDDQVALKPLRKQVQAKVANRPDADWQFGSKPKEQGSAAIAWRPGLLGKGAAVAALIAACKRKGNIGDLYVIRHKASGYELKVRVAEKARAVVLDGTPALRRLHRGVVREMGGTFGKLVSWGRKACRNIAGTNDPSDHALEPQPAAEDWHGSFKDMQRLARWLIDHAHEYDIHYIIFNGRIYSTTNNFQGEAYTGSCPHKEHVHVSVNYNHHNAHYC